MRVLTKLMNQEEIEDRMIKLDHDIINRGSTKQK